MLKKVRLDNVGTKERAAAFQEVHLLSGTTPHNYHYGCFRCSSCEGDVGIAPWFQKMSHDIYDLMSSQPAVICLISLSLSLPPSVCMCVCVPCSHSQVYDIHVS